MSARIIARQRYGTSAFGFARVGHSPAISDGRSVYYKTLEADGASGLWRVPVAGGEPRLLVRFDDPARRSLRRAFATDDAVVYFTLNEHESDV